VRRNRLIHLRKAVKGSLPTLPVFATSLGELVPHIQEMPGISALSAATGSTTTVQDYTDLQSATWEQKTRPALQAISDSVREVKHSLHPFIGNRISVLSADISACCWLKLQIRCPNRKSVQCQRRGTPAGGEGGVLFWGRQTQGLVRKAEWYGYV